jgi:hypothetical protein
MPAARHEPRKLWREDFEGFEPVEKLCGIGLMLGAGYGPGSAKKLHIGHGGPFRVVSRSRSFHRKNMRKRNRFMVFISEQCIALANSDKPNFAAMKKISYLLSWTYK